MSKGNKGKGSKGKGSVKRGKASKAAMSKASNTCCPIIHTTCSPTYKMEPSSLLSQYGESTGKKVRVAGPAKCTVRFGARVVKGLSTEAKTELVKQLSDGLAKKRCVAFVSDYHEKKAQRIKAAEERKIAASAKAMY